MTVFSLLYASRSLIPSEETEATIAAIVHMSRSRNLGLNVTGCLIFGGGRFAQVLEGERVAVEDVMGSISRDPRHKEVNILERGVQFKRRFAGWHLGYSGPSFYVQRMIATPASQALSGRPPEVSDLLRMMFEFYSGLSNTEDQR